MIFGEKAVHHVQAYLSIRTFQKQLEADDHIYVMTTHPEYYQSSGVEAIPVTDETIRDMTLFPVMFLSLLKMNPLNTNSSTKETEKTK